MRTTVTLDDDVVVLLAQVRANHRGSLKEVINTALRSGLLEMSKPAETRRAPFRTKGLVNGPASIQNMDNVAEVLAAIEGEDYK